MKKINFLIVLGLFVLLAGVAQPVFADAWDNNNAPGRFQIQFGSANEAAHLNAALGKFNGLLNAYFSHHDSEVWNQPIRSYSIKKQLSIATNDLSSSLEQFNTALMEVYPTLSEEEQLAVREAYSSLGSYLEDLAAETNSIFGREVFRIEYGHPDFFWLPTPYGK